MTPEATAVMDVVVEDGAIADVDAAAQVTVDEEVDARGLHLLPGVVDDQVHFREPGLTHKEDLAAASRACAKGGVTTFLEMPNTRPAATTVALQEEKLTIAAEKSLVNYGFYIGATEETIDELKAARRTPGIKIFVGSSTGNLLVDRQERSSGFLPRRRYRLPCTPKTKRPCGRTASGFWRSEAEAGVGRSFANSRSRRRPWWRPSGWSSWHIGTNTGYTYCICRRRRRSTWWQSPGSGHGRVLSAPSVVFGGGLRPVGNAVQMNPSVKTRADNAGCGRDYWTERSR